MEVLAVYSEKENVVIIVVYRQPEDSAHGHPSAAPQFKEAIEELTSKLSSINKAKTPDIFIGGDFNLLHVSWAEAEPSTNCKAATKAMLQDLNEFCAEFFLTQKVYFPTHKDGNILDLVFTNNDRMIHDVEIIPTLYSISHHKIIQSKTLYKSDANEIPSKVPRISRFDSLNFFEMI